TEAQRVAEVIADAVTFDRPGPVDDLWHDSSALQTYVEAINQNQHRDLVILDLNRIARADAEPNEVGERFPDPQGIVSRTLADGVGRTFVEVVGTRSIRQLITPIRSADGKIVGGVVLEYSPLYDEMLQPTGTTMKLLIAGSLGCLLISA